MQHKDLKPHNEEHKKKCGKNKEEQQNIRKF